MIVVLRFSVCVVRSWLNCVCWNGSCVYVCVVVLLKVMSGICFVSWFRIFSGGVRLLVLFSVSLVNMIVDIMIFLRGVDLMVCVSDGY